jgi:hypothetical protein
VTHSATLLSLLDTVPIDDDGDSVQVKLYKDLGETRIDGQGLLSTPPWDWGTR